MTHTPSSTTTRSGSFHKMRFPIALAAAIVAFAPVSASAHGAEAAMLREGDQLCILSDGSPNHAMGRFPNRANPNAFVAQDLRFCFPAEPAMTDETTYGMTTVGVTLSGVPIRPYTAGYYDPDGRGGIGPDPSSGWRQQAMHAPRRLGMDEQNAHVDRAGIYHYHAVSPAYLESLHSSLIGYAPDGFEIHYMPEEQVSSWQLKDGDRPTPPFGSHDGTFEEDFEFVPGSGTLDECNGAYSDDGYRYYATDGYPFFPRCFKGVVSRPFMTQQ